MLLVSLSKFWRGVRGSNPHALGHATDYKSVASPISLTPRQNGVTGRFSPTSPWEQQGVLGVMNYGHTQTVRGSRPTGLEPATSGLRNRCSRGLASALSRKLPVRGLSAPAELRARTAHGNFFIRTQTIKTHHNSLDSWGIFAKVAMS